jgi:hypothetical protein
LEKQEGKVIQCGGLIGYADDVKGCRVSTLRQNYRGVVRNFEVTKIYE